MAANMTRADLVAEVKRLNMVARNAAYFGVGTASRKKVYQDAVRDADEAIDQLAAHQAEGWISVEDRLPDVSGIEDGEAVLVANRGGSFCAEWHGTGITGFSSYGYGDQFVQVTHWMPLPAAPPIPSNGGAGEAL